MPNYQYKARNSSGKLIEGTIVAESQNQTSQLLKSRELIPITIKIVTNQVDIGKQFNQ